MFTPRLRFVPVIVLLFWIAAAGTAAAQTVYVRTTPGLNVELDVNSQKINTLSADAIGTAEFTLNLFPTKDKIEADVHVFADVCGNLRRVILVEAGNEPAPADSGCRRTPVRELLAIRPETSLVVNVDETSATVLIRQGPPAPWWIGKGPAPSEGGSSWDPVPKGLILGGSIGLGRFSNINTTVCGDASSCTNKKLHADVSADVAFWLTRNLAGAVSYTRLTNVHASGSGTNFTFNTSVDTAVITLGGKVGGQAGPIRLYVMGGANYLLAASTTSETFTASATTTAATGTLAFKANGWGWVAGGGMETWPTSRLGIFLDLKYMKIQGDNTAGKTLGSLKDNVPAVEAGVRLHLWK